MVNKRLKKYSILGVLFFLPVIFLLFLYPSKHNYNALDIVNENVSDISNFSQENQLKNNITVLGFFGKNPLDKVITASNLKELVYDKFKGFKKFQIIVLLPDGTQEEVKKLEREIRNGDELKYWHFVFASEGAIKNIFSSLSTNTSLDASLATDQVYIIDKDLNQRGRIDDREDFEIEKNKPIYGLESYNCVEVAEIKNKMSEDVRILFTEYRQKRKGNFDSSARRASDLKNNDEK